MLYALRKWPRIGWKNVCKLWLEERTPEQLKGEGGEELIYRKNWESFTMARKIRDYAVWRMKCQKARPDNHIKGT